MICDKVETDKIIKKVLITCDFTGDKSVSEKVSAIRK